MRKIIILSLLSCVVATVQAKEYPIKATMIKPVMQNSEYQLENFEGNNFLGTLTCPNGAKPKIYNSRSVYIPEKEMWSPKDLIRYSILGDVVSKLIETDSVFLGLGTVVEKSIHCYLITCIIV